MESGISRALAVILTVERSIKRRKIKQITKEKEKKRQENQKNEVVKGKVKIRKEKEKIRRKISKRLLTNVSQRSWRTTLFFFSLRLHQN